MLSLFWIPVILILVLLILAVNKHFKAVARVGYYADQGMTPLPGYDNFFIGNGKLFQKWRLLRNENQGK